MKLACVWIYFSANSLFALPTSQNYVFLYDHSGDGPVAGHSTVSGALIDLISKSCPFSSMTHENSHQIDEESCRYEDKLEDFREFLTDHIHVALTKGFDDDTKRVAEYKHFFCLPTLGQWIEGFKKLSTELFSIDSKVSDNISFDIIHLLG